MGSPFESLGLGSGKMLQYRLRVLLLTFLTYASFHMSRKAPSIVKGALHPHVESAGHPGSVWNPLVNPGWEPFSNDLNPSIVATHGYEITLSDVCEVNSDVAGVFECQKHACRDGVKGGSGSCMKVAGDEDNITFCESYHSQHDHGKFRLHLIDDNSTKRAKDLCIKHGNEELNSSTFGCWVLSFVRTQSSRPAEISKFCQGNNSHDCTLYVQPQGHYIPAPSDDKVGWINAMPGRKDDKATVDVSPSDITNGKILLGSMDTVYLVFYALGLFVSGHVADQMSLRLFLAIGMSGAGTFVILVGLADAFKIHSLGYFYVIYAIQGLFQSTGWPAVVAVMGNWFPKSTRGLVMGAWNAHTSVGNIAGSLISGAALSMGMGGNDWPAAFYISGAIIFALAIIIFLFLPNKPEDVGLPSLAEEEAATIHEKLVPDKPAFTRIGSVVVPTGVGDGIEPVVDVAQSNRPSFVRALMIPGVMEFAFALFFAKFVAYMFIYWLPYYLGHLNFKTTEAANISAYFDVGGIVGGIIAGWASDRIGRRAPVAFAYLLLALPALFLFRKISADVGDTNLGVSIALMLMCGLFVNGPYALITTAVSADLGTHPSLKGNLSLTATVTGIIDGTGSLGASIQGVLIGIVASGCNAGGGSWHAVFNLLMICCVMSALCLTRLVWKQGPTPDPSGGRSLALLVYRVIVVALLLGMAAVGVYCAAQLFSSCGGAATCDKV